MTADSQPGGPGGPGKSASGLVHPERPGADLAPRLSDPTLYAGDPFPLYAQLRKEAPIAWNPVDGFWAVTTHDAVVTASTDPSTFCSAKGILVQEIGVHYDSPPTMMHTDPPAHTVYRRMVQPGFKPQVIRQLEETTRTRAGELVGELPPGQILDVVATLSVPFPLQIISEMLGVPSDEWPRFFEWSEAAVPGAVDWPQERIDAVQAEMVAYLLDVAAQRRANPRDDVVSALATATTDGRQLSDDELAMFLVQLLVAGNETTRNMLSGGIAALADRPEQWQRLRRDRSLVPKAVEEILRWTTPVIAFMRTATQDAELGGQRIAAGEPVLLIYASANRDEKVFGATAGEFDVGRDPNPHLGFGFGPHFCLGAALARLEARVILEALLDRFAAIELAGDLERAPSPVIAGIRHLPLRLQTA